jgi:hypothetical protein
MMSSAFLDGRGEMGALMRAIELHGGTVAADQSQHPLIVLKVFPVLPGGCPEQLLKIRGPYLRDGMGAVPTGIGA